MSHVEIIRRQIQSISFILTLLTINMIARIIGYNGIAYFLVCAEIYLILCSLINGGLSEAFGHRLRIRNAKGKYHEMIGMGKNIMISQIFLSLLGAVVMITFGRFLSEKVLQIQYCSYIMFLFIPAIIFRGISSVLLGITKGYGTELPGILTCVLRSIMSLVFCLIFCKMLTIYGQKVSQLLGVSDVAAMYGGMGAAIAVSLSELLIVIFLSVIALNSRKGIGSSEHDFSIRHSSFMNQFIMMFCSRWVHAGVLFFSILPLPLGMLLLRDTLENINTNIESCGLWIACCFVLCGICVVSLFIYQLPLIGKLTDHIRMREKRSAKSIFRCGLYTFSILGFYQVFFVIIFRGEFAELLCPSFPTEVSGALTVSALFIPLIGFLFYFGNLLNLLGKKVIVLISLAGGNLVFSLVAMLLKKAGLEGIQMVLYAGLIVLVLITVSMGILTGIQLHQRIELLRLFILPLGISCISGLIGFILERLLLPHMGNIVTILVCFFVTFSLHWTVAVLCRGFHEQDLMNIPGGKILRAIGQLLHVY